MYTEPKNLLVTVTQLSVGDASGEIGNNGGELFYVSDEETRFRR
jgi:hypothetical protein